MTLIRSTTEEINSRQTVLAKAIPPRYTFLMNLPKEDMKSNNRNILTDRIHSGYSYFIVECFILRYWELTEDDKIKVLGHDEFLLNCRTIVSSWFTLFLYRKISIDSFFCYRNRCYLFNRRYWCLGCNSNLNFYYFYQYHCSFLFVLPMSNDTY